jgi:hypothetical protein
MLPGVDGDAAARLAAAADGGSGTLPALLKALRERPADAQKVLRKVLGNQVRSSDAGIEWIWSRGWANAPTLSLDAVKSVRQGLSCVTIAASHLMPCNCAGCRRSGAHLRPPATGGRAVASATAGAVAA